jgi:purine/pyrimidine-nucleoside phosphorylase
MIKVNEYFDGNVKSLALENAEGRSTVGVIAPGEYEFGTSSIEIMHVVSGELNALLPGSTNWVLYPAGSRFRVEKGVKFKVQAKQDVAYWCQYF